MILTRMIWSDRKYVVDFRSLDPKHQNYLFIFSAHCATRLLLNASDNLKIKFLYFLNIQKKKKNYSTLDFSTRYFLRKNNNIFAAAYFYFSNFHASKLIMSETREKNYILFLFFFNVNKCSQCKSNVTWRLGTN